MSQQKESWSKLADAAIFFIAEKGGVCGCENQAAGDEKAGGVVPFSSSVLVCDEADSVIGKGFHPTIVQLLSLRLGHCLLLALFVLFKVGVSGSRIMTAAPFDHK